MKRRQRVDSEGVEVLGTRTPEEVLTLEEASAWLKLRPEQVYELTRSRCARPLPCVRAGKWLRFRLSEINGWLTQKTHR
jgi:hypothetical protein